MQDWYPAAKPMDGPSNKHGGYSGAVEPSPKHGLVVHSMEGSLSAAMGQLNGSVQVSWHFSNPKVGQLLQHYPVGDACWASGGKKANVDYVACEHEGKAGEALTDNQVNNLVGLIQWLVGNFNWPATTRPLSTTDTMAQLYEHKEMTRFGSSATACPSGRIPWDRVMAALQPPVPVHPDGWASEPPYQTLYNGGVPVFRVGGPLPGQISKLFGDRYLWLVNRGGVAMWEPDAGD